MGQDPRLPAHGPLRHVGHKQWVYTRRLEELVFGMNFALLGRLDGVEEIDGSSEML